MSSEDPKPFYVAITLQDSWVNNTGGQPNERVARASQRAESYINQKARDEEILATAMPHFWYCEDYQAGILTVTAKNIDTVTKALSAANVSSDAIIAESEVTAPEDRLEIRKAVLAAAPA